MKNKIEIFDAHHHFWDLKNIKKYSFLSNPSLDTHMGKYEKIIQNYLYKDLKRDYFEYNLLGSIHVEAGWQENKSIEEVMWLYKLRKKTGFPAAVVAYGNLEDKKCYKFLLNLKKYNFVKGIRMRLGQNIFNLKEKDNKIYNNKWLNGFKLLEEFNYSFEMQSPPQISKDVFNLAKKNENINIVISHTGFPLFKTKYDELSWKKSLKLLSQLPNVYLKISGIPMMDHNWNFNSLRSKILFAIDTFTPDKVMFGSNFPVDKLYSSAKKHLSSHIKVFKEYSNNEFNKIIKNNTKRFYKID